MTADVQLSGLLLVLRESYLLQLASVLALIRVILWLYTQFTLAGGRDYSSISQLDGPPKTHWLLGNLTDLHFRDVGDPQISWQKLYGPVFRMHGLFGDKYLMISDPKAVGHIFSTPDAFLNRSPTRYMINMVTGPGMVTVEGDAHKRQRHAIQPAFGIAQLRALFPVFFRHSQHLSEVLKRDVDAYGHSGRIAKLNMHAYVWKTAMDVIGEAAFHHEFNALNNKQDIYSDALNNVRSQSLECKSKAEVFAHHVITYVPSWMMYCVTHLPIQKFSAVHTLHDVATRFAKRLVKEKVRAFEQELEGSKDFMSLLVRANAMEKQENKLSDLEINSEVNTFTFAAQETVTNSISFGLWELAKNMDMQHRIRREILTYVTRRDDVDVYEQMPLLNAFIKEVLRYHPIAFNNFRNATRDAVIPLSKPVKLLSGQLVNELPVPEGLKILINTSGYNRLPELFGPDADEFNIDRWLDTAKNNEKKSQGVGIYANLMTFGHGHRSCIGWRFAIWEMQVVLVTLLSEFEFTLPVDGKVRRAPAILMYPTLEGTRGAVPSMSLNVSILQD